MGNLGSLLGEGKGYPLDRTHALPMDRTLSPLEKGKATHSSLLAWRIPWTIQSMGLQRVGHD